MERVIIISNITAKNKCYQAKIDGEKCIIFVTGGKYQVEVIVDIDSWEKYLYKYHWTAYSRKKKNIGEYKLIKITQ